VGQERVVREVLTAILAGGHVLLEGVPGLGKTLLVKSMATALGLGYSRVQCTPDLIPADITGTNVLMESEGGSRTIRFQPGPIFHSVVLADEINRATPKTQSGFLEAMEERQVTVAGTTYPLPLPFIVLATQNPIELEGTFPLPEAQIDRFLFKVVIDYPGRHDLIRIAGETTGPDRVDLRSVLSAHQLVAMQQVARHVPIATDMLETASSIVQATHPSDPEATEPVRRFVRFGASPRAVQALVLGAKVNALMAGRLHVSRADLATALRPALCHRVLLNFEAGTSEVGIEQILTGLREAFLS
jgi:MoxR-like ATPase